MKTTTQFYPDLIAAQKILNATHGLACSNLKYEQEGQEYGASTFDLYDRHIQFRVAKITPKKIGLFVTFWKRSPSGPIEPFDDTDQFDFLIVSVSDETPSGLFIFPKSVLFERGCLSKAGKGGKRALRVYPPWSITENQQAQKTQSWQLLYFIEMSGDSVVDAFLIKKILSS